MVRVYVIEEREQFRPYHADLAGLPPVGSTYLRHVKGQTSEECVVISYEAVERTPEFRNPVRADIHMTLRRVS